MKGINAGAVCAKFSMSASSALSASPTGDLLYMHEVRPFLRGTFTISSWLSVKHASVLHSPAQNAGNKRW